MKNDIRKQALKECGLLGFINIMLAGLCSKYIPNSKFTGKMRQKKFNSILKALKRDNKELLAEYNYISKPKYSKNDGPIWLFWWQGEDVMPDNVRNCIANIRTHKGNYKVNVVSKDNYDEYIYLPDCIIKKFKEGKMNMAHLSDILRFSLIEKYGGLWVDASVFFSEDIPDAMFDIPFYSIRGVKVTNNEFVSEDKWVIGLIGGCKHNMVCKFMSEFFVHYWTCNDYPIDYLMTDFALRLAYDNIETIKSEIDGIFVNNTMFYKLESIANEKYDKELLDSFAKDTFAFRFSWKNRYEENKSTWYGHFCL